jgi:large repetitive protein
MTCFPKYKIGYFLILPALLFFQVGMLKAQCGTGTPVFTVDMSKNADSTWLSSSVTRNDSCCGSSPCIKFVVTLSPDAQAITLDIYSGAVPPGALYYNVSCGGSTAIGTPICLSGAGPHVITFCKPGNNQNIYRLHSIMRPRAGSDIYVRDGCTAKLTVAGLIDSTIHWQSVTNNSVYNSYLSCTDKCNTTYVTPKTGRPSYVDYVVCGKPGIGCQNTSCDTVRVYFINTLKVNILPDTPTICYQSNVILQSSVSGGRLPYKYTWSTGDTSKNITVSTAAIYWLKIDDASNCPAVTDSDLVRLFTLPIAADAGQDTLICSSSDSVKLNGKIQAAYGGIWSGGTGTFNPSRTVLNAYYKPSASEIAAGSVMLILHSTGNSSCKPAHDTANITISQWPTPKITGPDSVCQNVTGQVYSTSNITGDTYDWVVNGGVITTGSGTISITVSWANAGKGTLKLTETNAAGCKTIVLKNIKIIPRPSPAISGDTGVCEYTTTNTYSTPSHTGDKYQWTVSGGTIISGTGTRTITVYWGYRGTGKITLKETNASGCDTTVYQSIAILPKPAPVITGPASVCQNSEGNIYYTKMNTGSSYQWTISGGRITGPSFGDSIIVKWGSSGIGKLSVTETNASGCDTTVNYTITIKSKPKPACSGPVTVCERTVTTYSTINVGGDTYTWTVIGGIIVYGSGTNSIKVRWGNAGSGSITLTETNSAGCDSTISENIIISPKPKSIIHGADSSCQDQTRSYATLFEAGVSYKWSINGGSIITGTNTDSIVVLWGKSGTGNITLTETNTAGLRFCDRKKSDY